MHTFAVLGNENKKATKANRHYLLIRQILLYTLTTQTDSYLHLATEPINCSNYTRFNKFYRKNEFLHPIFIFDFARQWPHSY